MSILFSVSKEYIPCCLFQLRKQNFFFSLIHHHFTYWTLVWIWLMGIILDLVFCQFFLKCTSLWTFVCFQINENVFLLFTIHIYRYWASFHCLLVVQYVLNSSITKTCLSDLALIKVCRFEPGQWIGKRHNRKCNGGKPSRQFFFCSTFYFPSRWTQASIYSCCAYFCLCAILWLFVFLWVSILLCIVLRCSYFSALTRIASLILIDIHVCSIKAD